MNTASSDPANAQSLKRLEEALIAASTRAPFSAYLRCEFDAFTQVISNAGRRWEVIAKWAQDEGHTNGKAITPMTAKRAYEREKAKRARGSE